jgi:DNA-binding LytR/AlgR family response regulator
VPIKTRGRLGYVDLASIEWIESQGNYLALHVCGRSHLIRGTLQSFAGRLDQDRFVRVHRRVIVAIDRVREIEPLANGDSTLILQDGHTIRASRSYRDTVRKRWAEFHGLPKDLPRTSP